jgi:hypothetical protein
MDVIVALILYLFSSNTGSATAEATASQYLDPTI